MNSISSAADLVLNTPNLIAFWDFQDERLEDRSSRRIRLTPHGKTPDLVEDGVFGRYSLPFSTQGNLPAHYLVAERERVPHLGIGGLEAQVTIVAWLAKHPTDYGGCQFIAGVWNEHHQRQYALFLNLAIRNFNPEGVIAQPLQAAGHFSSHGRATPGWPYCMDGAVGKTPLLPYEWHTVATSYDGKQISLFVDGVLDTNPPVNVSYPFGANPFPYSGGIHRGNADFTIGATRRPDRVIPNGKGGFRDDGSSMANPFSGLLGGIAIFDRALLPEEQTNLASVIGEESFSKLV